MPLAELAETIKALVAHFRRVGLERCYMTVKAVAQDVSEILVAEDCISVFEKRVDHVFMQTHCFEEVAVSVTRDRRDAHARYYFAQPGFHSVAIARGPARL